MSEKSERSSLGLSSNIMLKSRYEKDPWGYLSPELLPSSYSDLRIQGAMTIRQKKQFDKKLFYAETIIDE